MSTIFLTGASGFIGQALALRLAAEGHHLRLATRTPLTWQLPDVDVFNFSDLNSGTDWSPALDDVDVVIHCAGRAHVMHETAADPLAEFRRCNVDASVRLARQAARAGVRRFVFVSSIKVCGEQTLPGQPFTVDSVPAPADPYAISKLEAERALFALTASSTMEVVIVRPPLVYGPGVKANFLRLMQWLERGRPFPLIGDDNRRSLISRGNLVDLLTRCIDHPSAAQQILHASDGEDLSTPDLLRRLGNALGKPARLVAVPTWLVYGSACLLGRRAMVNRLYSSLQVDISHTTRLLNWSPPFSITESLAQTAAYFLKRPQG
jgi:nucleoside-diphosphate-sugar epimerase